MNDQQILAGLKDNDQAVISFTVELLRDPVGYKLRSEGVSREDIDGITIDFLLDLIEYLQEKTLNLKAASFATYSTRACYYLWLNQKKKQLSTFSTENDVLDKENFDPPRSIQELIEIGERRRSLLKALEKLNPICKKIAELRLFTNKPWHVIAHEVNTDENNIRRKGRTCLNELYSIWKRYYP